jgi:aspartate carbamoyltransferase regulatory subunit
MVYLLSMEIQKIGIIGKVFNTEKRTRYGITIPNCFVCNNGNSKSKKHVRKGNYVIQYNGNTFYICKYCFSHKRKLKRILSQLS